MKLEMTSALRSLLKQSLQEDIGPGDLTTRTLIPKNQRGEAWITAKESGILSGGPVAGEVFRLRDRSLRVKALRPDGFRIRKGERALKISGRIPSILEAERVALNFLGHLSGIATETRRYVEKVKGTRAKIFDTRKTTPLWRELEKYAVRCGGGQSQRRGLWDEILVKDNHWNAIGPFLKKTRCRYFMDRLVGAGLVPALSAKGGPAFGGQAGRPRGTPLRSHQNIPIETEVQSLHELAHLLEGTFVPDRILLDNFSVRQLRRAVLFVEGLDFVLRKRYGLRRKSPELEASGGIHLGNVRQVAETGVDRISVGRLTHSAPALDFSLCLGKVRGAV